MKTITPGRKVSDNDAPYEWDRLPTTSAPAPFTLAQYLRLLILRSRVEGLRQTRVA